MRRLILMAAAVGLAACRQPVPPPEPDEPPAESGVARLAPARTEAEMLARATIVFDQMDRDGDDVLTAVEISAAEAERMPGVRRLRLADANEDDRVTIAEAEAAARARFARSDANGDGVIAEDERPRRRRSSSE